MHVEFKTKEEIDFFTCIYSNVSDRNDRGEIDCVNWVPKKDNPNFCKIGHCNCIKGQRSIEIRKEYKQITFKG